MASRRLEGLLALLLLMAATVGLPWALAATVRNPLDQWPDIAAGDMSDRAVMAILATVAYAAWATFVLAVLLDVATRVASQLTRRPHTPIRIPLLGAQQDLARSLIAAVLLLGPAVAGAAVPTVAAWVTGPAHASAEVGPVAEPDAAFPAVTTPVTAPVVSHERAGDHVVYRIPEVGGLRSYWALAEHFLGDPRRWPEIWALNEGRQQADGGVMESPGLLRRGWAVLVPAPRGDRSVVTVVAGDTLTGIADDHGFPEPAVWARNEGRVMSDGRVFDDPDLIKVGDTIILPGAPRPHVKHRPDPPAPNRIPTTTAEPTPSPPPSSTPPALPTVGGPTQRTGEAPCAATGAAAQDGGQQSHDAPVVAFAAGGAVLAGLTLAALQRHRRRQFRRRRPGRLPAGTPPELIGMERAVIVAGSAGMADVTWLDHALRSLVHAAAADPDGQLPDVIAVRMTRTELELSLAIPIAAAPEPWRVSADAMRWSIHRGDKLPYLPERRDRFFAPFPALVSVGSTSAGDHWLVDLERVGTLSMLGDADRCLDLARFLACELAHNTWSEMLHVTLVGFGAELVAANPDRLAYADDLSEAVADAMHHLAAVSDGLAAHDTDVLTGRLRDIVGDLWATRVVLVAPRLAGDSDELASLVDTLQRQPGRASLSVVLLGGTSARDLSSSISVTADGTATIPALGVELVAQQLLADEAAQLAQMLAIAATGDDEPVPAAHGEHPWDQFADACGALIDNGALSESDTTSDDGPGHRNDHAKAPRLHVAEIVSSSASVLPLPSHTYVVTSATTDQDVAVLAPPVDDDIRNRVEQADPGLDADLAAWRAEDCPRPRITLLGDVAVRAQGSLPSHSPQVAFHTEAAVYLATRPGGGVSSSVYAQTLWPNDPDVVGKPKVRKSINTLRGWLGRDPASGADYLPTGLFDGSGLARYIIRGALIDAELFRRLRVRGIARGSEGIGDLWNALRLVAGKPFAGLTEPRPGSPGGYLWLTDANVRLDHEYAAMIVDTAHTVATHHFGTDDPEEAARAAQIALRSGTYEDVPLLDLVRASLMLDRKAEAESYVAQILSNHDAEVEEDLPHRTAEVLHRLRREWEQRAS